MLCIGLIIWSFFVVFLNAFMSYFRLILPCHAVLILWSLAGLSCMVAAEAEGVEFFENHIRPVLVENCYKCHSEEAGKAKGELLLDTAAGLLRGGEAGPAIVPGRPEASLLMKAVSYESDDLQMPPKSKLSQSAIDKLTEWIGMGAPDPRGGKVADITDKGVFDIDKRKDEHWAWKQIRGDIHPPEIKSISGRKWTNNAIDHFIMSKLEAAKLTPNVKATRRTLIRRLYFDLIGLPPLPNEVEQFVSDSSPIAYENLIERLLASPHFGERWGQHWLDLVRFAETRGHEADYPIPEAFRYRNYVVRAFNADVPYDDFVVEHVAGDMVERPRLDPATRENESAKGPGFWHLGEATHSPVDIRGDECNRVHNQIDVYSKAFLAMTMGCARCHDHKFDAISTADYYAFAGILQSSGYHRKDMADPVAQERAYQKLVSLRLESEAELVTEYAATVKYRVSRIGDYLTLAAGILSKIPVGKDMPKPSDYIASHPIVKARSEESKLSADKLAAWISYLDRAKSNVSDPLYGIVKAELGQDRRDVLKEIRKLEADTNKQAKSIKITETVEEGERNYVKNERDWRADDMVADYRRKQGREEWFTGGKQFGIGPMKVGSPVFGSDLNWPIKEFNENGSARNDELSTRFSGLIRTRTFGVNGDMLWYRYKGKADVFMAVNSHRQVAGPLHGIVRQKLDSKGGDWKWHGHRVRDYIGFRVHVEFTPRGDFALERVQFGGTEPPVIRLVNSRVVHFLENDVALASMFVSAADDQAAGKADRETAQLLNWVIRNDSLLERPSDLNQATVQFVAFKKKKSDIEKTIPSASWALTLLDGSGEDEPILVRGNHKSPAKNLVPRSFLEALVKREAPNQGSGRMRLAERMVDPANPFVSRVLVNRIWHHIFGRGIVESVDNFGATGKLPSHPELLDFLSSQIISRGWSIKDMIRQMVLSSTYRQSSKPNVINEDLDPNNYLLHRMPIRRLQAEVIRDRLLAVSGRIDKRQYGKGPMVHITPFMRNNRSPSGSGPMDGDGRRSIYVEVRRNHLEPMLMAFDKPTPFSTIGKRTVSNSPAQPLIMLNNPFVHKQASIWADSLLKSDVTNISDLVDLAYKQAFGREPEPWESAAAVKFINSEKEVGGESSTRDSLKEFCHTLFNVKEFVFIY
ncbi:MAG: hypothetical protein CMO44_06665 [Verrucomicrobiales bacterium]|nr:hypothetical protein [Verrucomicrobiales bacterium]